MSPVKRVKVQQRVKRQAAQLIAAAEPETGPLDLALIRAAGWMNDPSWKVWMIYTRACAGESLAPDEPAETMEIFRNCTGRTRWPTRRSRETLGLVGRGGGKSIVTAWRAIARAVTFDRARYPTMAAGEIPVVLILAADREQGQVLYNYVLGALLADPALAQLIVGTPTLERIELRNGVVIQIGTSNFRWVRGRCYLKVDCDEAAFWSREHRANPAAAVLAAIRPGLRFTDSELNLISTPYAMRDAVWEIYQKNWGRDDAPVLVWKAPTSVMNPTLPQAVIDTARAADPVAAKSEWDAEFRSDMESFLPTDVVEAAVDVGVRVREWLPGSLMVAFVDPSGAGGPNADSFTIAFAHPELESDDTIASVVDEVLEIRPPFRPDDAVATIAEACRRWNVNILVGDKYAGSWPAASFSRYGLQYIPCTSSKSDLYLEALPLFTSGRVRLVDAPRLTSQLTNLERRSGRQGKDSVDRPATVGSHDDVANAVAGALVLCQTMAADLATAQAQAMSPGEAGMLASFSREFGLRTPPGGYGNLALDDQGIPVDRRYADGGWAGGGLGPNGYCDGDVGDVFFK